MNRARRAPASALLTALAAACASAPAPPHGAAPASAPEPFDYDWSVRTLDGVEVPIERYRGRVLVVNVWATWCPPCVAELASFESLARQVDPERVALLLVSPEPAETVVAFQRRHDLGVPLVIEERSLPENLGPLVLPTTFVADPLGRIALRHRGAADWGDPRMAAFLDSLSPRPEFRLGPADEGGLPLDIVIPRDWSLYAPDPGDAGLPLRLEWVWRVPGVADGERTRAAAARFPEPDEGTASGLHVRRFTGSVRATLAGPPTLDGAPPGALRVRWALCQDDVCVPGVSEVALDGAARPSPTRLAAPSTPPAL
jgi:thiol-disulfide isomerase/thioredoxin